MWCGKYTLSMEEPFLAFSRHAPSSSCKKCKLLDGELPRQVPCLILVDEFLASVIHSHLAALFEPGQVIGRAFAVLPFQRRQRLIAREAEDGVPGLRIHASWEHFRAGE